MKEVERQVLQILAPCKGISEILILKMTKKGFKIHTPYKTNIISICQNTQNNPEYSDRFS